MNATNTDTPRFRLYQLLHDVLAEDGGLLTSRQVLRVDDVLVGWLLGPGRLAVLDALNAEPPMAHAGGWPAAGVAALEAVEQLVRGRILTEDVDGVLRVHADAVDGTEVRLSPAGETLVRQLIADRSPMPECPGSGCELYAGRCATCDQPVRRERANTSDQNGPLVAAAHGLPRPTGDRS